MMFNDLRIGRKLFVGFGAVVAVITVSSATLFIQTRSLYETERLNSASDTAIDDIDKAGGDLSRAQSAVRKLVVTGAEGDRANFDKAVAAHSADLADARAILGKDSPDLLPRLDAYDRAAAAYTGTFLSEEARLAATAATRPQALEMVASAASRPTTVAMEQAFEALRADTDRWSSRWTQAGNIDMSRMLVLVALSGFISALLAGVLAWLIGRAIARPVGAMTIAMQTLASGDHAVVVPALGQRVNRRGILTPM